MLRQASLNPYLMNTCLKFDSMIWTRNTHVKKIVVKNHILFFSDFFKRRNICAVHIFAHFRAGPYVCENLICAKIIIIIEQIELTGRCVKIKTIEYAS